MGVEVGGAGLAAAEGAGGALGLAPPGRKRERAGFAGTGGGGGEGGGEAGNAEGGEREEGIGEWGRDEGGEGGGDIAAAPME